MASQVRHPGPTHEFASDLRGFGAHAGQRHLIPSPAVASITSQAGLWTAYRCRGCMSGVEESFLRCMSLLLARSGRPDQRRTGPVLGVNRTCLQGSRNGAFDPKRLSSAQLFCVAKGFYSITSSARPSSVSGKVRPRALAVLRLMTSSTFVDCWTGKSTGLAPFKMRPT
jgi:hypothetical protein